MFAEEFVTTNPIKIRPNPKLEPTCRVIVVWTESEYPSKALGQNANSLRRSE